MTSPVWMPLYVSDYLADTSHLTTLEHGAYMLLIMHYWRNTGLPDDEVKLARICRMTARQWKVARETLHAFFSDDWSKVKRPFFQHKERRYLPQDVRLAVFERDGFICTYCGEANEPLECDHVLAVIRGGSDDLSNLTTACLPCNRSKKDKTVEEWLG